MSAMDIMGCTLVRRAKKLGYSPTDGLTELEIGYEAIDWLEAKLKKTWAQLLDAKRNEERAVAELEAGVQAQCSREWKPGTPAPPCIKELRRRTEGTVADAQVERGRSAALATEVRELYAKLHTLESAVRAVLNDSESMYPLDREVVVELIALVES